ncbi:DoxX family protein [Alteribacillus sp. HJP-4]|uniref:DoxX family protein n=1 Tax=Alteribacillus sp. HJP-4 TaxID=2775394 RepID=UPI0035CD3CC0
MKSGSFSTIILIRYVTAFVFIVSGIMKIISPDIINDLELPFSSNVMLAVAVIEIICGILIFLGKYVKEASIVLLIIVAAALLLVKIPTIQSGVFSFLFNARLDVVMMVLLYILLRR